jgi:hypothetical protein
MIENKTELLVDNHTIFRISGLVLLIAALLQVPKAISAMLTLIGVGVFLTQFMDENDAGAAVSKGAVWTSGSASVGYLLEAILLMLLARWIFGAPAMIERWMNLSKRESASSGPNQAEHSER